MEAAEEVEEEIEAVLAIIMEGIDILRKSDCIVIKAQISPLTALDSEQCFVGYQLELSLDKNYPLDAPAVQVLFSKRFLVIFLAKAIRLMARLNEIMPKCHILDPKSERNVR